MGRRTIMRMNTTKAISLRLILLTVVAAMTLSACSLQAPPPARTRHPAQGQISMKRAAWSEKKPAHYSFEAELMCFCPETVRKPVTFEVKEGVTVATHYADGGEIAAELKELFVKHDSIDKIFAILQDAADRNASDIRTTFDPALGYPLEIAIDYSTQMADEELGLSIRNLRVL